ncbi:hypothetical protein F2P81_010040 [Scophthalmus maximus]|uniref:Uncharacterized protein n=1 Tax=Scophthalmus maximus TaxID=52904 RepID=A0A6A4SPU8_SCOMX|nr:hypothetical protein F2P81_010040 [Scophthalmus maximus]
MPPFLHSPVRTEEAFGTRGVFQNLKSRDRLLLIQHLLEFAHYICPCALDIVSTVKSSVKGVFSGSESCSVWMQQQRRRRHRLITLPRAQRQIADPTTDVKRLKARLVHRGPPSAAAPRNIHIRRVAAARRADPSGFIDKGTATAAGGTFQRSAIIGSTVSLSSRSKCQNLFGLELLKPSHHLQLTLFSICVTLKWRYGQRQRQPPPCSVLETIQSTANGLRFPRRVRASRVHVTISKPVTGGNRKEISTKRIQKQI